jgi:type I restriction enzyme S subunit
MTVDRVRVGEVLALQRREVAVEPDAEYEEIGVRSFGRGIFHKEPVSGIELGSKRVFRIEPRDLVLSNVFAWEGAIAVASEPEKGRIGSHRFMTFTPVGDRIDASWARWWFLSERGLELIGQASPGSAGRNRTLAIERFEALEIPLPPIEEQRRVAASLDRLANEAARLREARQLTTRHLEALTASRMSEIFAETNTAVLPIEALAEVRGGIQKSSDRAPGAHPVRYLTVAHVGRDVIRFDDPRYFEVPPHEVEARQLLPGDVLVIEGNGSGSEIGRAALFRGADESFVHQNHVIRVRPRQDLVEPDYLNTFLNSPPGRTAVQEQARTSSGLLSLSVGRIKKILVPLPAPQEQLARVTAARHLQEQHTQIREVASRSDDLVRALVPAALNEAFAGLT